MKRQRAIIGIGLLLILLVFLFPPWVGYTKNGRGHTTSQERIPHKFLLAPPVGYDDVVAQEWTQYYVDRELLAIRLLIIVVAAGGLYGFAVRKPV